MTGFQEHKTGFGGNRSKNERQCVKELLRTNNPVTISFAEALLRDGEIAHMVLDGNMSVLEGSLGILPRRILVDEDRYDQAMRLMREAGLEGELPRKETS